MTLNRFSSHKKIVLIEDNRCFFKFIVNLYRLRLNKEYFVVSKTYVRVEAQNRL